MQRQNRSEFAAGYGLPLVGPQLLIQEPESQRAALNSRPKLKPQTPPALAYCGQKMVLTKGSTLTLKWLWMLLRPEKMFIFRSR